MCGSLNHLAGYMAIFGGACMKISVWIASLAVVSMGMANPVFAEPPQGKGRAKQEEAERGNSKGKGNNRERSDDRRQDKVDRRDGSDRNYTNERGAEPSHSSSAVTRHFEERQRAIIRDFYVTEHRSGQCPPGLAKKNNGCMPPGQAKKWRTGQPLPRDVVFYDVPPALVVRIGTPPSGYRYVRVAADILLIAVGTGMVIDAITDLGNM
jgi:Ni/Co efflux regulator RcnB